MITVILLTLVLVLIITFVGINIYLGYEKKTDSQDNSVCTKVNNTNNNKPNPLPKNYYKMNCGNIVKNTENRFYLNEKIYSL